MTAPLSAASLIAVGILFASAPLARSDEWVSCKRDASTGQLLWLRGKSTEPLKNAAFRPARPTLTWAHVWSAMISSVKPTGSGSDHWFSLSLPLRGSKCVHFELSACPADRHVKKPISTIWTFAVDLPGINLHLLQRQKQSVSAASGALHLLGLKL